LLLAHGHHIGHPRLDVSIAERHAAIFRWHVSPVLTPETFPAWITLVGVTALCCSRHINN